MSDLLRDLRRRQQVRQRDGRWVLADDLLSVERELPESIRSAVQRKIEALDDADRRLLGAASVQGVDFDTALIAAALQLARRRGRGSARTAASASMRSCGSSTSTRPATAR